MSAENVAAHKLASRKRKNAALALTTFQRLDEQREARKAADNLRALKQDYLRRNPERAA